MAHARDHPVLEAQKKIKTEAEEWKVTPSHSKRWKDRTNRRGRSGGWHSGWSRSSDGSAAN